MAVLSKLAIINAKDVSYKDIPVPEWGGDVRVKVLTGKEREIWEEQVQRQRIGTGQAATVSIKGLKSLFLSLCIIDEEGAPMFGSKADREALECKSGAVLDRLWEAASALNGIASDSVDKAKKELQGDPTSVSGS